MPVKHIAVSFKKIVPGYNCFWQDTPSQSVLDVWLDSESDYVFINVT